MKRKIMKHAMTVCAIFGVLFIISGVSSIDYAAEFGQDVSLFKDVARPIIIGLFLLCPTLFRGVI